jgi:hypothetical protein
MGKSLFSIYKYVKEQCAGWPIVEQHSTVYYRDYCVQAAGMIAILPRGGLYTEVK